MEKAITKINEFYTLYKDSDNTLEKLDFYIHKQLPELLKKFNDQEIRRNFLEKESEKYINDFLTNPEKQYFYIKNTDVFIHYDGKIYTSINEDDLWMEILTDITSKEILLDFKQKIKNTLVNKIKEKTIFSTIPESYTVQHIINFFTPIIFDSKEDVKHFLALIGDNILNKKINVKYFVNIESKTFFDWFENLTQYYFGNKLNITSNIRYRYRGEKYENSRIIYFKKTIKNNSFWLPFIKENLFNLLVVSCHYSARYINSDNYVNKQNTNFKNKIFYLKNNTKTSIINDFMCEMANSGTEDDKISFNNIHFLWKIYLKNKNIPNIILKSEFETIIKERYTYSNNYLTKIKSIYLRNIKLFKKFWQNNIVYDMNDEMEISEIYAILINWFETNKIYESNFTEENLKDMIEYFYNDITINENKFLLGIKCGLWNKQQDILESFVNKFNKNIDKNLSIYDSYILYCKYSNNNNKILTVSKKYYYKYINHIIPEKFIKDGYILQSYWKN